MTAPLLAACAALLLRASALTPGVCTCVAPRSEAEAVRRSSIVFEGRPTAQRQVLRDGYPARVYTFTATRWRKGKPRRTVEVETGMGGGDCGTDFPHGRTYTVYAHRIDAGRLRTDICSGPLPHPAPPPALPSRNR